jgi:hypothetical protein
MPVGGGDDARLHVQVGHTFLLLGRRAPRAARPVLQSLPLGGETREQPSRDAAGRQRNLPGVPGPLRAEVPRGGRTARVAGIFASSPPQW